MEQIQKATLTLKTIDANIRANNNTLFTWNDINLPLLLGDMYNRFDNFNLKLYELACDDDRLYNASDGTYSNLAGADNNERIVTLNLSGLNFLNSTYSAQSNVNTSSTVIGTFHFYSTFSREYNNIVTFTKGSDRCSITIEYKTVVDNFTPATLNDFPEMVFLFSIYGIPRAEKK